jgi:plasmid stability protein
MRAMTIRGLDEITIKALKEKAKREGSSINAAVLKILRKELGVEKRKRTIVYTDLDHLAGTWDVKNYREFQRNAEDFENIDESMWK